MKRLLFLLVVCALGACVPRAAAQIVTVGPDKQKFDADSIRRDFDRRPFFGLYKDTYFTLGTAVNTAPKSEK